MKTIFTQVSDLDFKKFEHKPSVPVSCRSQYKEACRRNIARNGRL